MKNIIKRAFSFALVTLLSGGLLTSCDRLSDILNALSSSSSEVYLPSSSEYRESSQYTSEENSMDLDDVNEYLEYDEKWNEANNFGNKVTLIPFTHINGPRMEWDSYAIVTFEYDALRYYKYQVTYLSSTDRAAEANLWQTAYVELTVPASGYLEDVKLRTLSFENDGTGYYGAGVWGDSGTNGYDINGTGIMYEDIRDGFIPYLVGKSYRELSSYDGYKDELTGNTYDDTVWGIDKDDFIIDMEGVKFHDDHQVTLDDFNGASVSTNNMLRVILALMEYHGSNNI